MWAGACKGEVKRGQPLPRARASVFCALSPQCARGRGAKRLAPCVPRAPTLPAQGLRVGQSACLRWRHEGRGAHQRGGRPTTGGTDRCKNIRAMSPPLPSPPWTKEGRDAARWSRVIARSSFPTHSPVHSRREGARRQGQARPVDKSFGE